VGRVKTVARSTVVCLMMMVAACTDSSSAKPYAILSDEEWSLQEAVDPPQDDALISAERPPVDWYSEHVRTVPAAGGSEGQMIRLSGHSSSVDESRAALEELGWEFDPLTADGWEGVSGTNPSDPSSPAVALLDNDSTTFMLLSYELTVDEVSALAGSVEAVDETTWEASDGVIR
jgi:hypothetical protein